MHDQRDSEHARRSDERRDRAVRAVLWASLAVALAPMLLTLAVVRPGFGAPAGAEPDRYLSETLSGERSGKPLRALLVRSASGLARIAHVGRAAPEEPATPALGAVSAPTTNAALALPDQPQFAGYAAGEDAEDPPVRLIPLDGAATTQADRRAHALSEPGPALAPAGPFWTAREQGVFERAVGPTELTLSGAVELEDFASLRPISEVGVGRYLSGDPELHYGALNGSAARVFEQGRWRLKPELDLSASYLALDKVRLDAGEAGLFIPEADDWVFAARPSLELEGEFTPAPGVRLWPSLRAGATWLSQDEFSRGAMMLDAPALIAGLGAPTPVDETFADLEAGLGINAAERVRLSVRYGGLFGDAFESHTGRVELNMQF